MARSLLAACLAFAGVFVLAGAGWALLAGALLVLALWPRTADTALSGAWTRVSAVAWAVKARVAAAPRRVTAVAGMGGAVVLLPAGFGLALGAGAALIAGAAALAGVSLLSGWGA